MPCGPVAPVAPVTPEPPPIKETSEPTVARLVLIGVTPVSTTGIISVSAGTAFNGNSEIFLLGMAYRLNKVFLIVAIFNHFFNFSGP